MGAFNDWGSKRFSGLKDVETTLLASTIHPIAVLSLRVTNRTSYKILVNLKNIRNEGMFTTITTYENNHFALEPYERIDLVKEKGYQFHLEYSDIPPISESLVIYSEGYTQVFDCNISYITFKDLPLPPPPQ